MARKAREKSKTGIYNIIARSNDSLFNADADYDFFISILKEYIPDVYAYALTPGFICLVAKESEKGIGLDMKPLITKYARYYNRTYSNEGKIFEDRFKSEPINDEAELKNSVAILSNMAQLCGDGFTSAKSVKKYEMIPFYAKILNVEAAPAKKVEKTEKKKASAKKKEIKKQESSAKKEINKKTPVVKKETKKEETVKSTLKNTEQQRKNLPTWLL